MNITIYSLELVLHPTRFGIIVESFTGGGAYVQEGLYNLCYDISMLYNPRHLWELFSSWCDLSLDLSRSSTHGDGWSILWAGG